MAGMFRDAELSAGPHIYVGRQVHEADRESGVGRDWHYALALYPDSRRIR